MLWPPHCPSSDKWDHLSLAVLTQTWFTGLSLDHARSDFIVVLLPTPILLLYIYSTPWSSLEIICKKNKKHCNIILQNQSTFPVDHGKRPDLYILLDSDSLHAKLCGLYPVFFPPLFYISEVFHLLDKDKNGVIQISLPEVRLVTLKYHLIQLHR